MNRQKEENPKRSLLRLLLSTVLSAAMLFALFNWVILLHRVQGMDMSPMARDGDLLVAFRLEDTWQRGDVVIYRAEGKRRVGRIAAYAADQVQMTQEGNLLVNGAIQSGEVFYPTLPGGEETVSVPEGCVYILGDHRDACLDSRDFGPAPVSAIEGKVIGLFRIRNF